MGHFKKVHCSKRNKAINEIELETSQKYSKGEIEMVSINSVHMDKNWSLLIAELEMCAGNNKLIMLYKIDTRSEGNIMPWQIFKRLFKMIQKPNSKRPLKGTSN